MVASIPDVISPPKQGPLEAIDEVKKKYNKIYLLNQIASPTDYYNGDLKLNVIKVKCKTMANETDCLHQSNCGKLFKLN